MMCLLVRFPGPRLAAAHTEDEKSEQWYVIEASEVPAGWMHVMQTTTHDHITTEVEWHLTISRGSQPVSTNRSGRFIESTDGKPIQLLVSQRSGLNEQTTTYDYAEDGIVVSGRIQPEADSRMLLPEGEWLTPTQLGDQLQSQIKAPTKSFAVRHVDILGDPVPVTTRYELIANDVEVKAMTGEQFTASQWRVTQDGVEGFESIEFLDSNALLIRSETRIGAIMLTTTLSTARQAARRMIGPDLLGQSFVRPDRRIAKPRSLNRLVIDLSIRDGEDWPEIPNTSVQSVRRTDDVNRRRIVVDLHSQSSPIKVEPPGPEYLAATNMLQCDDASVKKLADRAVAGAGEDSGDRAEAIRAFVQRYVRNKSLDVAFASAVEVAAGREGDCTEHAILTAAMLRSQGLPSRVVTGLIYARSFAGQRNIFAYHMWAQGYSSGQWIDLDATQPRAFDAAHVALNVSAFEDGRFQRDMAAILPLLGRIEIQIIETQ